MSSRARLGNYEPLLELAAGGMGTVHVARHVGAAGFERLVVIKRVHRRHLKDAEFRAMFIDEARVASQIRHPNVVAVIDVVEDGGELFLVMEYVESVSMSALLSAARELGTPLPVAIVARILSDALAGLHAAHEATDMKGRPLELVHRDMSPQNVIVGVDGTSRLIDFGIAKAARRLTVTSGGVLKGKLEYMSPEQLKQLPLDARSDVFSAGVVLYEALAGKNPFVGDDDGDRLLHLLLGDVTPPSAIAHDVPEALDSVVEYALARDRDERFQSAGAFLQALETAVRPAPPRDVAREVARLGGEALEKRRVALRNILEAMSDPAGTAVPALMSSTMLSATRPTTSGGTDPDVGPPPQTPLFRWPTAAAVAVAVGVAAIGAIALRRGSADPAAAGPEHSAAQSSGSPAPIASPPPAGPASAFVPPSTAAATASESPRTPPAPAVTRRPIAPKPAATTDLHKNPYGSP